MPTIPYKEGKEFPELPTKTPLLAKIVQSNFVTEENPWYGKPTGRKDSDGEDILDDNETRDVVKIIFEVVEADYEGSRIWFNATASVNEKAKLRPLLEAAAFAEDPTNEELETYDTDDLVGQFVYVTGSFGPKDKEKKFLRPDSFMRYAKQFGKPAKAAKAAPKAEPTQVADDEKDEEAELLAKLEALKAKKAQTAPAAAATPARKPSTRERAQKALSTAPTATAESVPVADDDEPPF